MPIADLYFLDKLPVCNFAQSRTENGFPAWSFEASLPSLQTVSDLFSLRLVQNINLDEIFCLPPIAVSDACRKAQ